MRQLLTAIAAGVAAVALLTAPAGAVQGGTPDGNGHPNVGLSVFYYHGVPLWRCSGTMVAAQVYVTAGHCTDLGEGAVTARVWFQPLRSSACTTSERSSCSRSIPVAGSATPSVSRAAAAEATGN